MSVVYDVEGIVIGDRAKLEKIAEQYLSESMFISKYESLINE